MSAFAERRVSALNEPRAMRSGGPNMSRSPIHAPRARSARRHAVNFPENGDSAMATGIVTRCSFVHIVLEARLPRHVITLNKAGCASLRGNTRIATSHPKHSFAHCDAGDSDGGMPSALSRTGNLPTYMDRVVRAADSAAVAVISPPRIPALPGLRVRAMSTGLGAGPEVVVSGDVL